MLKGIRLVDGRLLTGTEWSDVEAAWSQDFMNSLTEPGRFREEIQNRAQIVVRRTEIIIDGSAHDFLNECERAGLVIDGTRAHNASRLNAKCRNPPRGSYFSTRYARRQVRRLERRARAKWKGE
jgi:hypothetical protein